MRRSLLNLPLAADRSPSSISSPNATRSSNSAATFRSARGDLGFRVWQKNANDLIDDTQVGVTLLHQDINYTLGRLSQEALNYVQPLAARRPGLLLRRARGLGQQRLRDAIARAVLRSTDGLHAGRPRATL